MDDQVKELIAKRWNIVQRIELSQLFHDSGMPELPNPFDMSIPKRSWKKKMERARQKMNRRVGRMFEIRSLRRLSKYVKAGSPTLPDPFDDAISRANWNAIITAVMSSVGITWNQPDEAISTKKLKPVAGAVVTSA